MGSQNGTSDSSHRASQACQSLASEVEDVHRTRCPTPSTYNNTAEVTVISDVRDAEGDEQTHRGWVRRGAYEIEVYGKRVGSVTMNDTFETPVESGTHTLQVRNGRNSSRAETFDTAEGQIVAFRCTGKRFLPLFSRRSFVPSLALVLVRE